MRPSRPAARIHGFVGPRARAVCRGAASRNVATCPIPSAAMREQQRIADRVVADPADELDLAAFGGRRRGRRRRPAPPVGPPAATEAVDFPDDDDHACKPTRRADAAAGRSRRRSAAARPAVLAAVVAGAAADRPGRSCRRSARGCRRGRACRSGAGYRSGVACPRPRAPWPRSGLGGLGRLGASRTGVATRARVSDVGDGDGTRGSGSARARRWERGRRRRWARPGRRSGVGSIAGGGPANSRAAPTAASVPDGAEGEAASRTQRKRLGADDQRPAGAPGDPPGVAERGDERRDGPAATDMTGGASAATAAMTRSSKSAVRPASGAPRTILQPSRDVQQTGQRRRPRRPSSRRLQLGRIEPATGGRLIARSPRPAPCAGGPGRGAGAS